MRTMLLAFVAVAALGMSGCLQSQTLVKIKADGSGTIELTRVMSKEMLEQMKQMEKEMNPGAAPKELFPKAEAEAMAPKLGDGVTFVSAEPVKNEFGEGLKAIYAFTDITKVQISETPDPKHADKAEPKYSFKFEKGETAKLTVIAPPKPAAPAADPAAPKKEDPKPEELAMMKATLKGMRMSFVVEVEGKLVKTSSAHSEGNQVTYMDIDFGALIEDEAQLKKLNAINPEDKAAMMALFKDIKGMKVNMDPEITIEFTGK